MKIRNGFVSNSSSSSFTINKDDITCLQIVAIKKHIEFGNDMGVYGSDIDAWSISESDFTISGYTSMDNFSMRDFLEKIGVPEDKIKWRD